MSSELKCASCGRSNDPNENGIETFSYQNAKWCTSCAVIKQTDSGSKYVSLPSPGRMYEKYEEDALAAWEDCYEKKPKRRILVKKAKSEITRAWELWNGDKSSNQAMFVFFAWLSRYRPYFLTFRGHGDPWQKVHSWLLQYERKKQ